VNTVAYDIVNPDLMSSDWKHYNIIIPVKITAIILLLFNAKTIETRNWICLYERL